MADDGDMDYSSESDTEGGLEEQYQSAKELVGSGTVEEALIALETVVEMDVERSKWGFKGLKQIVKLLMPENETFFGYYKRLFPYVESKSLTTNDVDKTLDSLWNRFCETVTDEERKRNYCLVTCNCLGSFPARTTRLKWLARLARQYNFDEYPYDLEAMVDDFHCLIQEAYQMEGISDNVKGYLFESLVFTSRIFLKLKHLSTLVGNLDRLKELASEVNAHVKRSALIKELQSHLAFVRGKYADSFTLLWEARKLYDEFGSSRSQQLHLQLRLISMLAPTVGICVLRREYTLTTNYAVWTEQCTLVEHIVRCFQDDDVVRLRSEFAGAEAKLGRFAAVEICGALLRNRISRRMAAENWLDSLACLSRWNLEGLKSVGQSMANLVNSNTQTLPLKNVVSVRVVSAHADQTVRDRPVAPVEFPIYDRHYMRISAHDGTLTIQTQRESAGSHDNALAEENWKTFATVATTERFPAYSDSFRAGSVTYNAISELRAFLTNAFVERFDWAGNFSWPESWDKQHAPTLHIKRLNHAFDPRTPRLLPLRSLGDVSVQLLEVSIQSWCWAFHRDLRDLLQPLKGAKVGKLSVSCNWVAGDTEEVSFVDACFAAHNSEAPPHFVVHKANIRRDFLVRIADKARQCRCECDVYVEMDTYMHNFTHLEDTLPDCTREDLGQRRSFTFEWPKNSLRIELEPYKLVARYSWKQNGD